MRIKKIFASLLSLVLCTGVIPATVASAESVDNTPKISDVVTTDAIEFDTPVPAATTTTAPPQTTLTTNGAVSAPQTTATTTNTTATSTAAAVPKALPKLSLGDLNGDGFVDSNDASAILSAYAKMSSDQESGLTYEQAQAADVNEDGHVDSVDASNILAYYAYVSTDGKLSIKEFLNNDIPPITTTATTTTTEPASLTTTSSTTLKPVSLTTSTTTTATEDPYKITEIKLSKTEISLPVGSKDISFVTMSPSYSPNKDEIWVSSDDSIATVDSFGWITGKKPGVCTVTVYSKYTPTVYASIKVTVTGNQDPDKITEIQLSKTELSIPVGKKDISIVTMLPKTSTQQDEIWVTSDEKIATVNSEGWITGVSAGVCTVTVYSKYTPTVYASIKVTVTSAQDPDKITEIQLSKTELSIPVGKKDISIVTMLPKTSTQQGEIWVTSDEKIATVDSEGWITGISAGVCTVTVYSKYTPTVYATIKVTVTDPTIPVTGITLTKYKMNIAIGEIDISYVTMLPANATNKKEVWTSSNPAIAKCDQDGWVKGVSAGTCKITVTSASNPNISASIDVTVTAPNQGVPVTGITLTKNKMTLAVDELDISYVTMLPANATNKNEIWTSSNPAVAKCDQYGWVKGVASGTCKITVTSQSNPNVSATIDVTVTNGSQSSDPNKVTGITLTKNKMTLAVGELDISYVTMLPANATNKNEIWTSSNPAVAKCDQYGWVKGVAPGTCTITVTSQSNPNVSAVIYVTVV